MKNDLRVQYSSLPDRQNVVAEIWQDKFQIAEIYKENGKFKILIFPCQSNKYWNLDFSDFLNKIKEIKL